MNDRELRDVYGRLASIEGSGTHLVSVYAQPERRLQDVIGRLSAEQAEAENIKSKRTRKRVQSALGSLVRDLSRHDRMPQNGIAAFAGETDEQSICIVVDELPASVTDYVYRCDDTFVVEPLYEIVGDDTSVGLLVLDRNGAEIGWLVGRHVQPISSMESGVMGKHAAGGQSAPRFERVIEKQLEEFFTTVAERAYQTFGTGTDDWDGLVVGGPTMTRDQFLDGDYLHHELQADLLTTVATDNATGGGLEELLEPTMAALDEAALSEEMAVVDAFFEALAVGNPVVYGDLSVVRDHAEQGAIEHLLVSEARDLDDALTETIELTERHGGSVTYVSAGFERGRQLQKGFGGIAGTCRFEIQ